MQTKHKAISEYEHQRDIETLNAHTSVSVSDVDGNIIYANSKFCQLCGYSAEELIGQNHRLLNSGQHSHAFFKDVWETILAGQIWQGDVCNKAKDGHFYWVKSTIVPYIDEEGKPYKFVSYRTDITDIKLANERLNLTISATGNAIWDWNVATGEFNVSPVYEAMLGYEEGELAPHIDTWINSVHPDDVTRVQTILRYYFEEIIDIYEVELRLRCKDGSWKWVLCRGKVLQKDDAGKPLTMMGIHTDISHHKTLEEQVFKLKDSSDRANKAKSEFLSSMSHELRTPLNAILGFSQLLEMDPLSDDQKEHLSHIISSGKHLLSLINDILDLSAIESQKINLTIEPLNLMDVVHDTLTLVASTAEKNHIQLQLLSCENSVVNADFVKLKQILINLITNAIKYNRKDGKVSISWEKTNDNTVRISVIDNGIGISQANQSKVFGAFNRLGKENSSIEGTGIGLVVTKRLVEMMAGTIGFDSVEGEGTTFWFELPIE